MLVLVTECPPLCLQYGQLDMLHHLLNNGAGRWGWCGGTCHFALAGPFPTTGWELGDNPAMLQTASCPVAVPLL
jgi:hypothetical protein